MLTKKELNEIRKYIKVHISATKPMDEYFAGMANGMIFIQALLTKNNNPRYVSKYDTRRLSSKKYL